MKKNGMMHAVIGKNKSLSCDKVVRAMWLAVDREEDINNFLPNYTSTFVTEDTKEYAVAVLRPNGKGGDFYDMEFNGSLHMLMQLTCPYESLNTFALLFEHELMEKGTLLTKCRKLDIDTVYAAVCPEFPEKTDTMTFHSSGDMEDWTEPASDDDDRYYCVFTENGFIELSALRNPFLQQQMNTLKKLFLN